VVELHASIRLDGVHDILGSERTEEVVDEVLDERVGADGCAVCWERVSKSSVRSSFASCFASQAASLRSCRPTFEDPLGLLHIPRLIRRHKTRHSNDLRVILVPATSYQPRTHPDIDSGDASRNTPAHGLVSCESNGLISLPMSM
jgi:hypothetical protein